MEDSFFDEYEEIIRNREKQVTDHAFAMNKLDRSMGDIQQKLVLLGTSIENFGEVLKTHNLKLEEVLNKMKK